MTERENLDQITESMIGAAIEVHRALGPGLLESAYEACLTFELAQRGLKVEQQKPPARGLSGGQTDCGCRLDLLVEEAVIVEVKTVDRLMPIHQAQLLSYLKFSGCKVGLLINCNVRVLPEGWHSPGGELQILCVLRGLCGKQIRSVDGLLYLSGQRTIPTHSCPKRKIRV